MLEPGLPETSVWIESAGVTLAAPTEMGSVTLLTVYPLGLLPVVNCVATCVSVAILPMPSAVCARLLTRKSVPVTL